jgi:hypothetical protein
LQFHRFANVGFKGRDRQHIVFAPARDLGRSACGYCKEPLPRKGLKYCGRDCYLRYSVEVAKPIEKAQAKLARMRAVGLNPGHGGEAARKRGKAIAENNRRRITGRGAAKRSAL